MNAERLGSVIGVHPDRVEAILDKIAMDPNMPTAVEKQQALDQAKDQYLAVMFLMNSDKSQYGSLVRDIENEYTRGTNTYPVMLSAAYDYIVNYRLDGRGGVQDTEHELSYYMEDGQGCSGRGSGRGGGHGCRNQGGHGGNPHRDDTPNAGVEELRMQSKGMYTSKWAMETMTWHT
jgi:hypothetical protein